MVYDYSKLRGRIVEKFGTQNEFARKIGISKNAVSKKMNGITQFSQTDIELWCELLEINRTEIPDFFYKESWTRENSEVTE